MAKVQVTNVTVLDNPSPFQNPFQFEVTFECFEDLPEGELVPDVTLSIDELKGAELFETCHFYFYFKILNGNSFMSGQLQLKNTIRSWIRYWSARFQ